MHISDRFNSDDWTVFSLSFLFSVAPCLFFRRELWGCLEYDWSIYFGDHFVDGYVDDGYGIDMSDVGGCLNPVYI